MKQILQNQFWLFKILTLVSFYLIFYSCEKDNNSPMLKPNEDMTGLWTITQTISGNCSGETYPFTVTEIFEITQTNNTLTITFLPEGDSYTGSISGEKIYWKINRPDGDGINSIDFNGTISENGLSMSGSANWQYSSATYSCSGSAEISGTKVTGETRDFEGVWEGTWSSEETSYGGSFYANVTQTDSLLTGTITVPLIDLDEVELSGKVTGNIVYFGDVNKEIVFVGIMEGDDAAGIYSYAEMNDEGSWTASRDPLLSSKKFVYVEKYPISGDFDGCSDLTCDGSYFWALSNNDIYKISDKGVISEIHQAPGSYPDGMAFDGTSLLVADGLFGSGKIYRLSNTVQSIVKSPGDGSIMGLCKSNDGYWCAENLISPTIYKIDNNGEVIKSFKAPGEQTAGMEWDGQYLWSSYWDPFEADSSLISKLDVNGNILKSFEAPSFSPGGLTLQDNYLWFINDDGLFKLDTNGAVLQTISHSVASPSDVCYDGSNFWIADGSMMSEADIVKINMSGEEVGSVEYPGQWAGGLTYDNGFICIADRRDHNIFRIPESGDFTYPHPAFDLSIIDCDGGFIYAVDAYEEEIVTLSLSGDEISSFSFNSFQLSGMAYDGSNFWYSEYSFIDGMTSLIKLNSLGEMIEKYVPQETGYEHLGLAVKDYTIWTILYDSDKDEYSLARIGFTEQ